MKLTENYRYRYPQLIKEFVRYGLSKAEVETAITEYVRSRIMLPDSQIVITSISRLPTYGVYVYTDEERQVDAE